ncbi:hypothetical protein CQ018_11055 [Arthrobacter sp. MYb227]|nr:hypothetical protein CQ018_11055 [Arthrobacter sp. MYb227]
MKNRTPLIILGITVLLVLTALVLVLVRGAVATPDPRSPEGVVQSYLTAALAGDQKQATALLTPQTSKDCPVGNVINPESMRVVLVSSITAGNTATVEVSITNTSASSPLDLGNSGYTDTFTLVKQQDSWSIKTLPWSLLACETETEVQP